MTPAPMSASDFQSLRSSCERCRFHKLKCTVLPETPGEPTRCARCTRAKVECVFERRARGKRTRQSLNDSRLDWGYPSPAGTDSSGDALPHETPRSTDNYTTRAPSRNSIFKTPTALNPDDMNVDFLFQQNQGFDPSVPILDPSTYNLWNMASTSNVFGNSFSNPVGSHNPGIGIQLPSGLPRKPSTEPREKSIPRSQSVPRSQSTSEVKGSASILRLSTLVTDIQQTTINLENSEWAYNVKQSGLERYPVGVVLQLAHEFSSILENLPRISDSHNMPSPPIQPSASVDSNSLDASTRLQMTSCYLLLTKLYGIVFSQMHDYLKATPSDILSPQLSSSATMENATLRLGDLTYSNDMWTKIYTVFRVMLDHLRNIGNAIGVPESLSIAQSLAGAEMGSVNAPGVLGRISQAALEVRLMSKVQPLRVLLRERLAL